MWLHLIYNYRMWDLLLIQQDVHDFASGLGHGGTGTEDGSDTSLVEEVVVLGGDDTTGNDHDVLTTKFLQLLDELRNEGLVTGSQRAGTNHIHVVLDSLASSLSRCLEQRAHIDVETAVGIAGSYYLGTTVVTVLTHLGYHDTRATALLLCKLFGQLTSLLEVLVVLGF